MAVVIHMCVLMRRVFVMVSIVNAICIVSCLFLLNGHHGGIPYSYLWTWDVTSGYSNYVYVCVIVFMYGLLCRCAVRGYALVWPVVRGVTKSLIAKSQVSVPFISRPVTSFR